MNKNKIYFIILSVIAALVAYFTFNILIIPILVRTILLFGILSIYYFIFYFFIYRDRCQICGENLENTFPKDFPKEFRVCCRCLRVAKYVYLDRYMEDERMKRRWLIGFYECYKNKFDNLFKIKKDMEFIKNKW